ncbi:hypothetical protein MMC08_004079 [Hypocenomyce scalaris]|nr:hypothetical protein [Hypocenomyce scalaris]
MGRAKKRYRDKLYTQAFFGEAPTGRHALQPPQRILNPMVGDPRTSQEIHAEKELADKQSKTVAQKLDQTPKPNNANEDEHEGPLPTRCSLRGLDNSQPKVDKPLKLTNYGQYEGQLNACFKELASLTDSYTKQLSRSFRAAKAAGNDLTKPLAVRVEAKLEGTKVMLYAEMEDVDFGLCMVQLFNVGKAFNCATLDYNRIRIDQAARHGIQLVEEPSGALVPTSKELNKEVAEDTKKAKKEGKPRKPRIEVLLAERNRYMVQTLKNIQAVSKSVSEEEAKVPCLSEIVTFFGQYVPVDIPTHVQQSLSDLEFVLSEMNVVRADLIAQRRKLTNLLWTWKSASKDLWDHSRKNLHQNPTVAKYDYTRTAFLALYVLWRQEEVKVYQHFEENKIIEKLKPALKNKLGFDEARERNEGTEEARQEAFEVLKRRVPPVQNYVIQCEEIRDEYGQSDEAYAAAQHGDWWKVLVPRLT